MDRMIQNEPNAAMNIVDAEWLWMPEPDEGYHHNQTMLVRRVWRLKASPDEAQLQLAADTLCRVYVNGKRVAYAPPLTDGYHLAVASHDVGRLLHEGENVVAAEVNTQFTPIGGLLLRLEVAGEAGTETLCSDSSWRVLHAPCWKWNVPHWSRFLGHSEVLDNRLVPRGWTEPGFDDSGWVDPVTMPPCSVEKSLPEDPETRETVTLRKLEPAFPIPLVFERRYPERIAALGQVMETEHNFAPPRDPMARFDIAWKLLGEFVHPLTSCKVDNPEALLDGKEETAATIMNPVITRRDYDTWWETHDDMPRVEQAVIIVDFGTDIAGRPYLDIDANDGAVVDMAWGEILVDGRVHPKPHPAWDDTKANRYTLREGRQRIEAFEWHIFRYLQITVRYLTRPARLHALAANQVRHDFDRSLGFSCSHETLQRVWTAWENTMEATVLDRFTDPRENGIWAVTNCVRATLMVHGEIPLVRQFLQSALRVLAFDGCYPNASPIAPVLRYKKGGRGQPWLYSSLGFADSVFADLWYGGDTAFFENTGHPWLDRLLTDLDQRSTPRGLFDSLTFRDKAVQWAWVDWSRARPNPDWEQAQSYETFAFNALRYEILTEMAHVVEALGDAHAAQRYRDRAQKLFDALYEHCWDP
ncbi:MAG: family 78 glycoside hydrolase catalytic domain, partial [Candidatus Pacebacteria bacterium]|nr:family 78 glycoside hydrolase catalytic domain [Candidatus Paceibacterota bacterium]